MKLEFIVPFKEGLHARPAANLARLCQKSKSEIKLTKKDTTVNPKSVLGIISLGASFEEKITFEIIGEDEREFAKELKMFFEN